MGFRVGVDPEVSRKNGKQDKDRHQRAPGCPCHSSRAPQSSPWPTRTIASAKKAAVSANAVSAGMNVAAWGADTERMTSHRAKGGPEKERRLRAIRCGRFPGR